MQTKKQQYLGLKPRTCCHAASEPTVCTLIFQSFSLQYIICLSYESQNTIQSNWLKHENIYSQGQRESEETLKQARERGLIKLFKCKNSLPYRMFLWKFVLLHYNYYCFFERTFNRDKSTIEFIIIKVNYFPAFMIHDEP